LKILGRAHIAHRNNFAHEDTSTPQRIRFGIVADAFARFANASSGKILQGDGDSAMPFEKISRDKYRSPSGRTYNTKQVKLFYAQGGHFPGSREMGSQLPRSHNSPTAPGAAARPRLESSGAINAATSPTPTSVLSGAKQTFGPLEYATRDKSAQGFWNPEDMARREVRRARREYNRRKNGDD
jgi:hypothetical protein